MLHLFNKMIILFITSNTYIFSRNAKTHFDIKILIFKYFQESAINGPREVSNIQYIIIHNCAVYKNIFIRNKRVERHGRGEVEDSHNVHRLCKNGT